MTDHDDATSYDTDPPNGLDQLEGVIGVRDTRDLGDYAARLLEIGQSSHTPFGDRIAAYAERLGEIAHEARRRLAADRLPDDQRERLEAARREGAVEAIGGEPAVTD